MKKRLISLILVFAMMLTMLPTTVFAAQTSTGTSENPFKDVKETDWCYDAVQYARVNGFFCGTSETTFDPNGTMTRGMFVTVLGRMAGVDTKNYEGKSSFMDVPASKYYAPYVAWAAKHGITLGTGKNTFSPNALINRAQMAAFFVRYFEAFDVDYETGANITTVPADMDSVPEYAKDAVLKLWKQGLLNGDGTNFNPGGKASRAQAATLTMRTDKAVEVWYKEPGVKSERVSIDPAASTPAKPGSSSSGGSPSTPDSNTRSVSFYDGNRLIDTLYTTKGEPLGAVPSVVKSSKNNAILLGYFEDPQFTQPFYAENPVTQNKKVYAQYEEMGKAETLNFTSYTQMDKEPDLSFEITGSGDPAEAVTLEVMDGSDPVNLTFTPSVNGYIVAAEGGFHRGCSYQLHLADGWSFYDKPDTIRTVSFSIFMEEVYNLQMNDSIVYIEDTDKISYTIDDVTYDVLTSSLITDADTTGSFTYSGDISEGDLICIYVGTHPEQRNKDGDGSDTLDPAVYVKVSDITGTTITFAPLSAEEQMELYQLPDNFPIRVPALPEGDTGEVNINDLDQEVYTMMMGDGYTLDTAKAAIEVGDFISLYIDQYLIESEEDIYFGEITAYDEEDGTITYKRTTRQAIMESMDLYSKIGIDSEALLTEEERREIEEITLAQVQASNFAEDAAYMLADMITKTDGFRSNEGIRDFVVSDANGNPLSDEQLELLGVGGSFELSDEIGLTVELTSHGSQFRGTQLAIGIEAEFEVELEDNDKIVIQLSATFVEEVAIDPRVKGSLVTKTILFIPIPIGVRVTSTIDVRNFTAFSFEAVVYTVAGEDAQDWSSFKNLANSTLNSLGITIPSGLANGAKTVQDVVKQIRELEDMATKAKDAGEQYAGYLQDAEALWNALDAGNGFSRADWEATAEAFGETSITSDLLDMMNLTTETGLEPAYYDSLEALLDRYTEMLEQESDWVKLVQQNIFTFEVCYFGVCIGAQVDFVVRTDLSLAIGSNLQYQVGKRYEFWFEIGLFSPTAGSSTMDLMDEYFAFQFYVMGRLGVKAGVAAKFYVGIGTGSLASVGITTELGPYLKLWGFFVYEYTKYRAANTNNWNSNERMAGALFLEFGLYFMLGFEAEALGLFEYSYNFLDTEVPLLTAGTKRYYYDLGYKAEEDEMVLVKDVDGDSTNGITMALPRHMLNLAFMDLVYGVKGFEVKDLSAYHFTVSNPNFSIDKNTGEISVTVPEGVGYMECDLTITYKHGKLAFSTYDMSTTVPLVWTNMSTEELSEFYTATVRVGNDSEGYETVWAERLLKNKLYTLPTAAEIRALMSWNDYKYQTGNGYGGIETEDLTLVEDKQYDFHIQHRTYSVTVSGVQNADGSTTSRTYTAKYGEAFDFSDLETTGTSDYATGEFTAFAGLTVEDNIDLSRSINAKLAKQLLDGISVSAKYVDCGVTATFVFNGLDTTLFGDQENPNVVVMKLRRGDTPNINPLITAVRDAKYILTDISPAVGILNASTTYQVGCLRTTESNFAITFVENGGPEVEDIELPRNSLLQLPMPERAGCEFEGWYSDAEFTTPFTETHMPLGGATVYAKWTANSYQVSFHINGGNSLNGDDSITVTYGQPYGDLPTASRGGYGFVGWFTEESGGTQITAESLCTITTDQTLYAQWRVKVDIPSDVFSFTSATYTYSKGVSRTATYDFVPEDGAAYSVGEFTVEYICQAYTDEGYFNSVSKAGTYNVRVTREADEYYNRFQRTYEAVLKINKATRDLDGIELSQTARGMTYFKLKLIGTIDDMDSRAKIRYVVDGNTSSPTALSTVSTFDYLTPGTNYNVTVKVSDDRNYNYIDYSTYFSTKAVGSSEMWTNHYDTTWSPSDNTLTINTPEQMAAFAYWCRVLDFSGKTILLGADIDMSAYTWYPIGANGSAFKGTFDGQGHTISGLYYSGRDHEKVGLFALTDNATIKNLVVDDSYFNSTYDNAFGANTYVGGIVARAERSTISNCVNHAVLVQTESKSYIGGIVGKADYDGQIVNCVNYGKINSGNITEYCYAGGIVGYSNGCEVFNNVNFGPVHAYDIYSGGIAGIASKGGSNSYLRCGVENCYNVGRITVESPVAVSYAILCRKENLDTSTVLRNCYYLSGSADKGSGDEEYNTYAFASLNDTITGGDYSGTLLNVLNSWVNKQNQLGNANAATWVSNGPDGYPLPSSSPVSALRK